MIPENFRGSRRSRDLARGSPFRHGLNPPPAATRSPARSLTQLEAWIRYIGIDLKAALSMPRSSRITCTHFGIRPMPLQACSGFCGSRYFAGLLRRKLCVDSSTYGTLFAILCREGLYEVGPMHSERGSTATTTRAVTNRRRLASCPNQTG